MTHKKKNKEDKNLIWIETKKDQSALGVALQVLETYEDDYNLTINEIKDVLSCERQWVEKNVKDNVKHIFLNENYRNFLKLISKQHREKSIVLKDFYYFSRKDFYRWLKENTIITRQTIRVDLSNYCDDFCAYEMLTKNYKKKFNRGITLKDKAKYYEDVYNTLNKKGKEYFNNVVDVTKRNVEPIVVKGEIPRRFTSMKLLKNELGKSLELVYRKLYSLGVHKYTILNSLVRYDYNYLTNDDINEHKEISFVVTIPYELYLK